MIKILFVCHGNICRSPMAEFVMQDLLEKQRVVQQFEIASAATSTEEIGNDVHPGTKNKLAQVGVSCRADKRARQMSREDYDAYDYLIGMDHNNIRNMKRICGQDIQHKIHLLLEFTGDAEDIADPWYIGNFDRTYEDIVRGCTSLFNRLLQQQ